MEYRYDKELWFRVATSHHCNLQQLVQYSSTQYTIKTQVCKAIKVLYNTLFDNLFVTLVAPESIGGPFMQSHAFTPFHKAHQLQADVLKAIINGLK